MKKYPRLKDFEIRTELHKNLLSHYHNDVNSRVVDEFGINGNVRIDIAIVNGALHGYEIKSDADTFQRLGNQVIQYSKVFDYLHLVVGRKHLEKAKSVIPSWWGLLEACSIDGQTNIITHRPAIRNPEVNKQAIGNLLWRDEAISILSQLNQSQGFRSKARKLVIDHLINILPLQDLQVEVRDSIRRRLDLRADVQGIGCADLSQFAPKSQRYREMNLDQLLSHISSYHPH